MKALALAACAWSAACGSQSDGNGTDGGMVGDAPGCNVDLVFTPAAPVAGDHIKVTAQALTSGVLDYTWTVDGAPSTAYEAVDHSAIGFDVATAVSHTVTVDISPASGCSQAQRTINVASPSGTIVMYRMRVIPPANLAPPQESLILVHGGQMSVDRPYVIDPGAVVTGSVVAGTTKVPAYLKWRPLVGPAFDLVTSTGSYATHAQLQMHAVLVIPQANLLAPRMFAWLPGDLGAFVVDAGNPVSGTVRDRSGTPLANAQVQLEQLGVPSTIATTAANGTYTVRTSFAANQATTATITPPVTSGLPKLVATALFDLTAPLDVSFAAAPASCDLAGTPVKRSGVNQASAGVTIVGALAGTAGTITNGTVVASATGTVHVPSTTGAGGTLPSTLVPRAALSAVIELATPGDLAVVAFDATGCPAQVFDAPARAVVTGTIRGPATLPALLTNVRIEASPIGALALASLIPVEATSTTGGAFALQLAAGAHYAVRVVDPAGRGSPVELPDFTAGGALGELALLTAIAVTGTISVQDDPNAIENASVQLLCASCTGVAANRPIAQTATDITGHYRIAVPDPGP